MSYANLLYHIVYGTKDRLPLITQELRPDLHRYLGGLVKRPKASSSSITVWGAKIGAATGSHV